MQNNPIFDRAVVLRDEGKYNEAARLFADLAKATDSALDKAAMLLNVTHALKGSGRLDSARSQLDAARELVSLAPGANLVGAEEEKRRKLLVGVELEDARIVAAEDKLQEATTKLNRILATHGAELRTPSFAEIYLAVQRDRGFLLTDLGSCHEALPILEEIDSADPHDRWTLFYLGYCYLCTKKFFDARQKLEESIQLGLTPDFEGRAHCALGATCYELKDYARAKAELEKGIETASPRYIKQAGIWQWLEYTCISLGLKAEAEHYRRLAQAS